jgi:hypothetical protein
VCTTHIPDPRRNIRPNIEHDKTTERVR